MPLFMLCIEFSNHICSQPTLRYNRHTDDWELHIAYQEGDALIALVDPPSHLPFPEREEMAKNTFELLKLRMKQE